MFQDRDSSRKTDRHKVFGMVIRNSQLGREFGLKYSVRLESSLIIIDFVMDWDESLMFAVRDASQNPYK